MGGYGEGLIRKTLLLEFFFFSFFPRENTFIRRQRERYKRIALICANTTLCAGVWHFAKSLYLLLMARFFSSHLTFIRLASLVWLLSFLFFFLCHYFPISDIRHRPDKVVDRCHWQTGIRYSIHCSKPLLGCPPLAGFDWREYACIKIAAQLLHVSRKREDSSNRPLKLQEWMHFNVASISNYMYEYDFGRKFSSKIDYTGKWRRSRTRGLGAFFLAFHPGSVGTVVPHLSWIMGLVR